MLRSIIFLLYIVIVLILNIPLLIVSSLTRDRDETGDPSPVIVKGLEIFLPPMEKIIGADYEISGSENIPEDPVLFVSNHQGYFDALTIERYLGGFKSAVVKKELAKVPVFNLMLKHLHCILIDRGNIRESLKSMNVAQRRLEAGQSVVIFPEGTRSKGPDMGEFKAGAFKSAIKAKVPVVPIASDGSYRLYEAQGYLKKAKVRVRILPPIDTSAPGLKAQDLCDSVQDMIRSELDDMRSHEKTGSDEPAKA